MPPYDKSFQRISSVRPAHGICRGGWTRERTVRGRIAHPLACRAKTTLGLCAAGADAAPAVLPAPLFRWVFAHRCASECHGPRGGRRPAGLDPRRPSAAKSRRHPAGSPHPVRRPFTIHVRASGPQGPRKPGGIVPPPLLSRTPHGRRRPCRLPHNADPRGSVRTESCCRARPRVRGVPARRALSSRVRVRRMVVR